MGFACSTSQQREKPVSIIWENNKATGIAIPRELITTIPEDSIEKKVYLRLAGKNVPAILGEYIITDETVLFKPILPFTRGLNYELMAGDKLINKILIPASDSLD